MQELQKVLRVMWAMSAHANSHAPPNGTWHTGNMCKGTIAVPVVCAYTCTAACEMGARLEHEDTCRNDSDNSDDDSDDTPTLTTTTFHHNQDCVVLKLGVTRTEAVIEALRDHVVGRRAFQSRCGMLDEQELVADLRDQERITYELRAKRAKLGRVLVPFHYKYFTPPT